MTITAATQSSLTVEETIVSDLRAMHTAAASPAPAVTTPEPPAKKYSTTATYIGPYYNPADRTDRYNTRPQMAFVIQGAAPGTNRSILLPFSKAIGHYTNPGRVCTIVHTNYTENGTPKNILDIW